jgi:pyruvate formate-lyase activating enzyme-like uncharacterized protein
MKTKYSSYNLNGLPEGCKHCVKGEKLVLFISGICSKNCWYCSLSEKRKNKNIVLFNERQAKSIKELIKEVKESRATSAGITGGDPLLFLQRTIKYARFLKKNFGNKFHIHIYIPTKLVTKEKLKKISKYIDEIRFNPEFSSVNNKNVLNVDIEKIKLASLFWKKKNIGIELPMIPDRKKDFLELIGKLKDSIGFVNLNEFELSETNSNIITKKYTLNEGGYTIKDSIKSGIWLLNKIKLKKINLKVHLCTAELKNNHQFKKRLLRHKILPFGHRTKEGMVEYLVINKKIKNKDSYYDEQKKRTNLSEKLAKKLYKQNKVYLVEEFPTFDRIETEKQEIK